MKYAFAFLALFAATPLAAIDPPAATVVQTTPGPQPDVASPQVVFPDAPTAPTPDPSSVTKLLGSEFYIVTANAPVLLLASPQGLVTISEETGRIRIRGTFAGGGGKIETRTYDAKQIFIIEAAGTGRIELLAVPLGLKKETEIVRRLLDVSASPRPPPVPPLPPPIPPPVPPPLPPAPDDPLFAQLQAAYLADPSPQRANQALQLASLYKIAAQDTVAKAEYTSLGMIYDAVSKAAAVLVPMPALSGVRQAIAADLRVKLPTDRAVFMDAAMRERCRVQFSRMAQLLEGVAK